MTIRNRYRN